MKDNLRDPEVKIMECICDEYCKYPHSGISQEELIENVCSNCKVVQMLMDISNVQEEYEECVGYTYDGNKLYMKKVKEPDRVVLPNSAFKLVDAFPGSFVNDSGEFIAHEEANQYFILGNCKDELEVKCKVLEWLSRAAFKTEPFDSGRKNNKFHKFMRDGINNFFETEFTEDDMEIIYTYLGNNCNRKLCVEFIESGYNMDVLKKE